MALGNNYNQNDNKGKQQYHPTVYSAYRMNNAESIIDQTAITFTYWNGALKISIAPKKPDTNSEIATFDFDNSISVYLNHTKARILYGEICKFQENPGLYNNVGIPSGQGLITLSDGKEFGVESPCIVIRKIDQAGATTSSYAYQFKIDYHYSIRNYDQASGNFEKNTLDYNNLEIEQLKTLLLEYYTAMTGAMAYSVIDQSKFENTRTTNKLDQIAEKLGVQFGGNKTGNYKSSHSVFNSSKPTNYSSSTLDDIEKQLEE